jgi:hypothetical protein
MKIVGDCMQNPETVTEMAELIAQVEMWGAKQKNNVTQVKVDYQVDDNKIGWFWVEIDYILNSKAYLFETLVVVNTSGAIFAINEEDMPKYAMTDNSEYGWGSFTNQEY